MHSNAVERVHDCNPIDNPAARLVLEELLARGHAKLKISRETRRQIDNTFAIAREYFAKPIPEKSSFALPRYVEGYREIGLEYSQVKERPDLTESFSLWNRNRAHTDAAGWTQSCPIHQELRRTIDDLSTYVAELFQTMADKWAPGTTGPRFQRASYIQVNYYEPAQHSRDMLQDGHEDGHLITLVTSNAPGLEAEINGKYQPVDIGPDEFLIMPGSLLTLMTGGAIPPLFHQVKNSRRQDPRYSMMFFVNPEGNQVLEPWIRNETNKDADVIAEANALPLKFGLPTLEDGTEGRGR
ncbi:2OG-Fe(II) oxygenase family protein [Dongia sp. agr-C8]